MTHRSRGTGQTAAFLERLNKIQINSFEAGTGYQPGLLAQPLCRTRVQYQDIADSYIITWLTLLNMLY